MIQQISDLLERLRAANSETGDLHRVQVLSQACAELEFILRGLRQGSAKPAEIPEKLLSVMQLITAAGFPNGAATRAADGRCTGGSTEVTDEVRAWAAEQFNEEEFAAGIRDIRETGGVEFKDFEDELERAAAADE